MANRKSETVNSIFATAKIISEMANRKNASGNRKNETANRIFATADIKNAIANRKKETAEIKKAVF